MIRWPLLIAALLLSISAYHSWHSTHSPTDPFFNEKYATEESAVPKLVRVKAHRLDKSPDRPMRSLVALSGTVLNDVPVQQWEKFRGANVVVKSGANFMSSRDLAGTVTYFGLSGEDTLSVHTYSRGGKTLEVSSRNAKVHARLAHFDTMNLMALSPSFEEAKLGSSIPFLREKNIPNINQAEWAKGKQFEGVLLQYGDLLRAGWSPMSKDMSTILPSAWVLSASRVSSLPTREESFYVTIPGSPGWVWLTPDVREESDPPRGGAEEELVGLLHARDARDDTAPLTEPGMPLALLETDPEAISRNLRQYWVLQHGWKALTAGALLIAAVILFIRAEHRRQRDFSQGTGGSGKEKG